MVRDAGRHLSSGFNVVSMMSPYSHRVVGGCALGLGLAFLLTTGCMLPTIDTPAWADAGEEEAETGPAEVDGATSDAGPTDPDTGTPADTGAVDPDTESPDTDDGEEDTVEAPSLGEVKAYIVDDCASCHHEGNASENFAFPNQTPTDEEFLETVGRDAATSEYRLVEPGAPNKSEIYLQVESGSMPLSGGSWDPDRIGAVEAWIASEPDLNP